jgi:broad specificity phosphatase PhoE
LENKDRFGLSEKGKVATRTEAKKFKNFDFILSSPFRRTMETAMIFAETSQCKVIECDELREVCVGDWEHCVYEKTEKQDEETPFPNGESLLDAKRRAIAFFKQTNQEHKNKNILIVTHGPLVQNLLLHVCPDIDWGNYWKEYDHGRRVFAGTRN